jgi:hypothetical protein
MNNSHNTDKRIPFTEEIHTSIWATNGTVNRQIFPLTGSSVGIKIKTGRHE